MESERVTPSSGRSLWTGPRDDPRRYRIDLVGNELESVGDGGEGLVFRATGRLGGEERVVALKMHTGLTLADFDIFAARARVLSHVEHPGIMRLVDAFVGTALSDDESPPDEAFSIMYTAAEWISGLSLPAALEATSPASGLRWIAQVARATAYLHGFRSTDAPEGVVHRDLKPSNIRITPEQNAVLIDFGIARPHREGDLTEGAGTYLWRAPEVIGGPGDPGPASDVWGIGALSYWILLAEPPRLEGAETAQGLLTPALREAGFADPKGLSRCIGKLLETHPERRPNDLTRWASELESRVVATRPRRHAALAAMASAVLALLVAIAVLTVATHGSEGATPAKYAFTPESFQSKLTIDRTCTLSVSTHTLSCSILAANSGSSRLRASYDLVIPKSIAPDVGAIRFVPDPSRVLQRDPVVRYLLDLAPQSSRSLRFAVVVPSFGGVASTKLRSLTHALEEAEQAYASSNQQGAPLVLTTLSIIPSSMSLAVGQQAGLTLLGTMNDKSAATRAELEGVVWSSDRPQIALVEDGVVAAVSSGTATVTAQAGALSVRSTIDVAAAPPPSASQAVSGAVGNPGKGGSGAPASTPGRGPQPTTTQVTVPGGAPPNPPPTTQPTIPATTQPTIPATTQPTIPATTQPTNPATFAETTGGLAHTWTNYTNAGGTEGPSIASNDTVQIACKVTGFRVADGNTWWYRVASSPWNDTYYVSADAFYNNGQTSGSLVGTPFVDPNVSNC